MLWLESRIAAALPSTPDPEIRSAIHDFVDTSLAAMPTHLRAGVVGESIVLGTWLRLRGITDDAGIARQVTRWETNPIGVIRQYARLFGSLVLFAEQERLPA